MDFVSVLIGLVLGLIIGAAAMWAWVNNVAQKGNEQSASTEAEIKALLAQQAHSHIQQSQESIRRIELELSSLQESVAHYENTLVLPLEDETQTAFFGEHASVFLRNTQKKANKLSADKHSDAQPKDFANHSSGLFVGHPALESLHSDEKTNN